MLCTSFHRFKCVSSVTESGKSGGFNAGGTRLFSILSFVIFICESLVWNERRKKHSSRARAAARSNFIRRIRPAILSKLTDTDITRFYRAFENRTSNSKASDYSIKKPIEIDVKFIRLSLDPSNSRGTDETSLPDAYRVPEKKRRKKNRKTSRTRTRSSILVYSPSSRRFEFGQFEQWESSSIVYSHFQFIRAPWQTFSVLQYCFTRWAERFSAFLCFRYHGR